MTKALQTQLNEAGRRWADELKMRNAAGRAMRRLLEATDANGMLLVTRAEYAALKLTADAMHSRLETFLSVR